MGEAGAGDEQTREAYGSPSVGLWAGWRMDGLSVELTEEGHDCGEWMRWWAVGTAQDLKYLSVLHSLTSGDELNQRAC